MTPTRLVALTRRALGRAPSQLELEVWGEALACRGRTECPMTDCPHDDEADQALKQHTATSTFPPTPADVRRIAVGLANLRVEALEREQRDAGHEQRVPPTEAYLAARRAFDASRAERQRALDEATATREASRAAAQAEADAELAAGSPS